MTVLPIVPPAPKVHTKDLPLWRHLPTALRNGIAIFSDYAFDAPFARRMLLGIEAVLVNDPTSVRHVQATNAANYIRPTMIPAGDPTLGGSGHFSCRGFRVAPATPHAVASLHATQRKPTAPAFQHRRQ
jgi:hypothetical protein